MHSPKRKEDEAETEEDDEEEKERAGSEREHKGLRQEKKEQEAGKKQEKRVAVIVVEVVRQQKMQSNYPMEKRQKKVLCTRSAEAAELEEARTGAAATHWRPEPATLRAKETREAEKKKE